VPDDLDSLTRPDRLEILPAAECRGLLAANTLGRIGITSGGLPVILPVRYRYEDGVITFQTGPGMKLRSAESGEVLAFEIDGYDRDVNEGWSVVVQGRASVTPAEHEILGAPGFQVRLGSDLISGRRVVWG
jgi:nitroimidazol reductase NimA-like FMN-containing flavoprotein (pyridoxamine 5'-phosphate oxidase superfamily)